MNENGYIYLRDNKWFLQESVIKMGITTHTKNRENTYITGEIERGYYIYVVEIPLQKLHIIDKILKNYFKHLNIYKGGGTEFYKRNIIFLIEPFLQQLTITYRILTNNEILCLNYFHKIQNIKNINKIKTILNTINFKNFIEKSMNVH